MFLGKTVLKHLNLSKLSFVTNVTKDELTLLPKQGFSNENYSFMVTDTKYLLRKFKLQDRDRALEYKVQTLAYEEDMAAKPLHLDLIQGFMVCEYLEGKHHYVLTREDLSLFATQLQKLHTLSLKIDSLDLKSLVKSPTPKIQEAFLTLETLPKNAVLCHNDLNPKNCIFLNQTLKFIDWEFAAFNDCYFDLASVCVEFDLSFENEAYFLTNYFNTQRYSQEKLEAYKVIYKALCVQWFENHCTTDIIKS
jgi:thiamine kinase-like enzyme